MGSSKGFGLGPWGGVHLHLNGFLLLSGEREEERKLTVPKVDPVPDLLT